MFTPFSVSGCSLALLKPGEQGIVIFYQTHEHKTIETIISMGITIGTSVILEQQLPTLVVKISGQNITINSEISRAIYVRIVGD